MQVFNYFADGVTFTVTMDGKMATELRIKSESIACSMNCFAKLTIDGPGHYISVRGSDIYMPYSLFVNISAMDWGRPGVFVGLHTLKDATFRGGVLINDTSRLNSSNMSIKDIFDYLVANPEYGIRSEGIVFETEPETLQVII
jgi:hypothetical protein